MATWEDGPEYAPLVRPDGFSSADVAPLEVAPPVVQPAAGAPKVRPQFSGPQVQAVPLAALVPTPADQRDPQTPFDVAASTVTSMNTTWGADRWNPDAGVPVDPTRGHVPGLTATAAPAGPVAPPANQVPPPYQLPGPPPATVPGWGAPTPTPTTGWGAPPSPSWPAPTAPVPPVNGPATLPGGYPPPGTPQWFGPGPGLPQQQPAPVASDARAVLAAATPGLCITLAMGLIYVFAPFMLVIAFILSKRVQVAQQQIRQVFRIALGFLGFMALVGLVRGRLWFTDWWSFVGGWAFVICWAVLAIVLVLVHRELKSGRRGPGPSSYPTHWG